MVHASRGQLRPRPRTCAARSRSSAASREAPFGRIEGVDWARWARDYSPDPRADRRGDPRVRRLRDTARRRPAASTCRNGPRDSRDLRRPRPARPGSPPTRSPRSRRPAGHLLLQTIRSHDQFNTTVYGLDDRYRGIKGGRRVVFVNPDDLTELGIADGETVDLVAVVDRRRAPRRGLPAWSRTRPRAAAPRRTSRRRTSSSRSTPTPTAAAPRRRSRSSFASRRASRELHCWCPRWHLT